MEFIQKRKRIVNTIIFVFIGEFGYELFNWQGIIRKFKKLTETSYNIVSCSRKGMKNFYETCDRYVDISDIEIFKKSIANGYVAGTEYCGKMHDSIDTDCLINEITNIINPIQPYRFCISNKCYVERGLYFGLGDIYDKLDLNNNLFVKINPDLSLIEEIKEEVNFNIEKEPFILIQNASRSISNKSSYNLLTEDILNSISFPTKTILLGFDTMRNSDSKSVFSLKGKNNLVAYNVNDFVHQGCLIYFAKKCIFFTEGDLRSHIYVPPFMGRDVYAVAHKSVFDLPTAPINFWNKKVFKFGGQIIPVILSDDRSYNKKYVKEIVYA